MKIWDGCFIETAPYFILNELKICDDMIVQGRKESVVVSRLAYGSSSTASNCPTGIGAFTVNVFLCVSGSVGAHALNNGCFTPFRNPNPTKTVKRRLFL